MMMKTIFPPLPVNLQRLKVNIIMGQSISDHPEDVGPAHPPPVAEGPPDVGPDPRHQGDAEANEEEADEDDPDAGIEVDVYEGSSIKRKVGVLKRLHCSLAYPDTSEREPSRESPRAGPA